MGGLLRHSSTPEPRKPSIHPVHITEEEDPVPFYLLDESAGIEPSSPTMGTSFSVMPSFSAATKRKMQQLTSAMRKPSSETNKLKKFVRFLDRVEVVPAPLHHTFAYDEHEPLPASQKKQKLSYDEEDTFYAVQVSEAEPEDIGIASGLGRAGSPNRSPNRSPPNRSPNASSRDLPTASDSSHLSVPRAEIWSPPSPPPSWRIPPESLVGRQPYVQEPPRVRSPVHLDEEINLRADEHERGPDSGYLEDLLQGEKVIRPGVSYVRAGSPPKPQSHPPPMHPVIARKMWPHGEIRFEDQWGRRLIQVGHKDSFRFDLWPVEEDAELEGVAAGGPVRGAWVRGRAMVENIPLH